MWHYSHKPYFILLPHILDCDACYLATYDANHVNIFYLSFPYSYYLKSHNQAYIYSKNKYTPFKKFWYMFQSLRKETGVITYPAQAHSKPFERTHLR